jgi:uncharacterized protein YjbJ (UPF0337 family)
MGLFDMFKDKAAELIQSAKEQVGEVTGIDVQAPIDELIGTAPATVTQTGQDLTDNAAGNVAEVSQNLTDTVDKTINDGKDRLTGN